MYHVASRESPVAQRYSIRSINRKVAGSGLLGEIRGSLFSQSIPVLFPDYFIHHLDHKA